MDNRVQHYRLNQYGNRCDWLKDDKFLKDLEGDSVDTEILDEELRSLQDDEPKTCRGKSVKWLESNPFQIVLCFLVLVDAGVVIAEILLDLHAIRGQYNEAYTNLRDVLAFVKDAHADELDGYQGNNVDKILGLLHHKYDHNDTETESPHVERHRRHVGWSHDPNSAPHLDMLTLEALPSLHQALVRLYLQQHDGSRHDAGAITRHDDVTPPSEPPAVSPGGSSSHRAMANLLAALGNNYLTTTIKLLEENIRLRSDIAKLYDGLTLSNLRLDDNRVLGGSVRLGGDASVSGRERRDAEWPSSAKDSGKDHDTVVKYSQKHRPTDESHKHGSKPLRFNVSRSGNETVGYGHSDTLEGHHHSEAQRLHKIAHILHYCSIAILGIFVIQLLLKVYGMGIEFFKKRMEIFDAVIILASFALDLVFLEGIGGAQGEEAAALLIVFLLWRILRVINGIMITTKKRQEFRIKLQKRARRRAEKKIEILEEDRQLRDKEISALKELCAHLGGKEDEIAACKPRRKSKGILSRLDTSMGLTSVASLSLSLSMSMSGGVLNMARANPMINRRDSLQENMPARMRGPGISRPSTMGNNVRDTSPLPRRIGGKTSMEAVIEESPLEDDSKKANGAMVTGDTLALPPAQSTSTAVVTCNNTSSDDKPPPDGTPVSVQTIVHEENETSPPPSKTPPRLGSRTSLGRVTPPSTGGTPPRTSPSTPPLGSPHGSWMHLGPLEGTSSLGGSAVLSPKSGTPPREGARHPPGTPPRRFSGVGTPVSLSPCTPPSPGPPMLIPLSKSPRQDRRRPPPVPPKPKKLKGILKRSEDSGRGRSPSPAPSPVFDDYDHDKVTSPLLRERARTPSPRMRRRSRTPSPRMDRKATKEKEKDKRGKVLSKGKGKRRGDRPRSSVQLEFENELATPGQPPRRARSSETIVVANGPLVRGLSPSLSALRSSREDVMVRLQGRGQMSPGDSRVQTTKL